MRTGLCNAYLAASVVGSSLVRISQAGGMGMVSAEVWPFVEEYCRHCLLCNVCLTVTSEADVLVALLQAGDALQLVHGAVPVVRS